ncbi:MAG: hypothetical protein L6265_09590 [Thermoplasmatales archaeon]|nr:hypothetical protein [Thermoplasmatales archaeon]
MKEWLGRYYLVKTALFYSGFELNEKKKEKENSMFLEQIIDKLLCHFRNIPFDKGNNL